MATAMVNASQAWCYEQLDSYPRRLCRVCRLGNRKDSRTKAKRLIVAGQKLVQTDGGHVPPSMAELLTTTGMYGTGSGPTDRFG
jgi:hypothetical protein